MTAPALDVAFEDEDVQEMLCHPDVNPDAAAYFITNFCETMDEDRAGAAFLIPAKRFVVRFIRELDFRDPDDPTRILERANLHVEKSRRMLATWIICAYNLWALMYLPGYTACLISDGEDLVDDGGRTSTPDSMFGRMRHMHDRLPRHVWRAVEFTRMKARLVDGDAFVVGGAPTKTASRGGGYTRIWIDEHAFLKNARAIHAAADPACKFGKVYNCTVNGPDNLFAELKLKRPRGWRFVEIDWRDDKDHTVGLRETKPGPERERYGDEVSDWFIEVTASLDDQTIAREYRRKYDGSNEASIYGREFDRRVHVTKDPILLDPNLPVWIGVDYGSTGVGAASLGQKPNEWRLDVFADYELKGAGGASIHASNIWDILVAHGYEDSSVYDIGDVIVVGGPDTDTTMGNGQTIGAYFREFGFALTRQCRVRGPGSVLRRILVVKRTFSTRRVNISPTCETLILRIPKYNWPVDPSTGKALPGKSPALGEANHTCDGFGYLCCEAFPTEVGNGRDRFRQIQGVPTAPDRYDPEAMPTNFGRRQLVTSHGVGRWGE